MGIWTDLPNCTWHGPTPNHSGPMLEQRGQVVHIAEGGYDGTISWCNNPHSGVSCHFVVAADGRIAQLADTDVTVWTQIAGNGHWVSVENEGFTPHPLTAAQVEANAQILAKGHKVYGWPLQLAINPNGRGLGHHSMGTNGHDNPTDTWTGATWGHEDCPGPAIYNQKPAIVARAIEIVNGDAMTAQEVWDYPLSNADGQNGSAGVYVGMANQYAYYGGQAAWRAEHLARGLAAMADPIIIPAQPRLDIAEESVPNKLAQALAAGGGGLVPHTHAVGETGPAVPDAG